LLFGPSTGPPRPSIKETAQGAGKTHKEEEEEEKKEEEVDQQLFGQRTSPPATETSIMRYRPAVPDSMNSSSEKGPFSHILTARRWIVVEPMATTEEDAAADAAACGDVRRRQMRFGLFQNRIIVLGQVVPGQEILLTGIGSILIL
jgi:hypothetical protein